MVKEEEDPTRVTCLIKKMDDDLWVGKLVRSVKLGGEPNEIYDNFTIDNFTIDSSDSCIAFMSIWTL